jgi:hypothetical protein
MFNLAPIFKRQAKPAAKRTPPAIRRVGKGRKELTTITADPLMAAPMLTTWDVTGPDGVYLGAFQGSTPDDAILSYVATQGYASIDDAALAMGFADAMTFAASFIVTETLDPAGMDPMLAPVDPLAAPAALSRRGRRPCFVKMGEAMPMVDSMPSVDPGIVSGVTVTEATLRRYRAVVSRSANATAVVEFDAYEDEDLYKLAEALVPQIPAEAWSVAVDPNNSWGYIDRIEPLAPAADPALTTLSRRRRKFARKMADDFPAILDFLAGFTPEQIDAVVTANDWGMIGAEWDGTAWVGVYADGMNEPLSENTVAEIAYQLGYVVPAATLSDDEMIEDDEETPAEIARRSRLSRKFDVSYFAEMATGVAILMTGTWVVAEGLSWLTDKADEALDAINAWWNAPTEAEKTAELDRAISSYREMLAELDAGAAQNPENETYLADARAKIAATLSELEAARASAPPAVLSARSRRATARRLALKAAFTVADATTGDVLGTYDATTSDDAILSYVAEAGYETIEAAAAGMGFATVEEFLASISVAEGAEAEAAPAETPAETLSRRHRLMRKATFDVADPTTGEILGTFDAGTIDDAILSYAASLGFASADEAAAAAGVTVEEWLATFTITEAAPAADAPPAEAGDEMLDEYGNPVEQKEIYDDLRAFMREQYAANPWFLDDNRLPGVYSMADAPYVDDNGDIWVFDGNDMRMLTQSELEAFAMALGWEGADPNQLVMLSRRRA